MFFIRFFNKFQEWLKIKYLGFQYMKDTGFKPSFFIFLNFKIYFLEGGYLLFYWVPCTTVLKDI